MRRKLQESGSYRPPRGIRKTHTPVGNRVKQIVVGAIREIYANRELLLSQRLGIIELIPKSDKNQRFIKNWRPFALLETFYKIISATLAYRIKQVPDSIIGQH